MKSPIFRTAVRNVGLYKLILGCYSLITADENAVSKKTSVLKMSLEYLLINKYFKKTI